MKKLLFFVLLTLLAFCYSSTYASDEVIAHIYSTDILAYVNGEPIKGYNIGGKTVVIAEVLDSFGFDYEYNDEERMLSLRSSFNLPYLDFAEIQRGKTGEIVGDVYKTDIKVTFNSIPVDSFNIGGRTAICLEDLGNLENSPNASFGYSKYFGKSTWNEKDRTISFDSYTTNFRDICGNEGVSRVSYKFRDNVLYAFSDDFAMYSELVPIENDENFSSSFNYSDDFDKHTISPLYLDINGEKAEIGTAFCDPNEKEFNHTMINIYDPTAVKELIKKAKTPKKSHDEAIEYFENTYKVTEKIENDDYTVLMIRDEKEVLFVYISKKGGFVVDTFLRYHTNAKVLKMWFNETDVNASKNAVVHEIYPYGGPHGPVTMQYVTELDNLDYN